jgi:hypothetical protein
LRKEQGVMLDVYRRQFASVLEEKYRWQKEFYAVHDAPPLPTVDEALALVEGYIRGAAEYFEVEVAEPRVLALAYPHEAAEIWCAHALHQVYHVARERARAIVAEAMEWGILDLTAGELSRYAPEELEAERMQHVQFE